LHLYFSTNVHQYMESYILLENIQIYAHHGVFNQETLVGNNFVVNLKIKINLSKAVSSDNLNDTVSYALVYEVVKREMTINSKLLEHVAGRIVSSLKKEFQEIEQIELKLSKLNPPVGGQVESASVVLID
jgi:dihydroneopterin aldolase